jgi:hypothetical protein
LWSDGNDFYSFVVIMYLFLLGLYNFSCIMTYFDEQGCFLLAVSYQTCGLLERKGEINSFKKRLWCDHELDGTTPIWEKK